MPSVLDYNLLPTANIDSKSFVGLMVSETHPNCCVHNEPMPHRTATEQQLVKLQGRAFTSVLALYKGQATPGVWLTAHGLYFFYCQISKITRLHDVSTRTIGGLYAKAYRAYHGTAWYDCYDLNSDIEREVKLVKHQFVRQNISMGHHTLIRPEEVLASLPFAVTDTDDCGKITQVSVCGNSPMLQGCYAVVVNAEKLGNIESAIATFMLYAVTAPDWCVNFLTELLYMAKDAADLTALLKQEGLVAKQLQHNGNRNLSPLFELNVLVNRMDSQVDWAKEKSDRTLDSMVCPIRYDDVLSRAKSIFRQALNCGVVPRRKTWKAYWETRWATLPTGSIISQYPQDIALKKAFPIPLVANKTTVLSTVNELPLSQLLNRTPQIYSTASVKYEWGKVRALYGCDITSSLITDFALGDAELCLPGYFPVGPNANSEYVKKAFTAMKGIPVCYDYDNFNAQHTKSSMRAVLEAWLQTYEPFLSPEQILSAMWSIDSISNLTVNNNMTSDLYQATSTLFSGWRLTSFVNTVLNRVYIEQAGLKQKLSYALHNGDDIYGVAERLGPVFDLIDNTHVIGIRAQKSKMAIGTIGEFLRVDNLARTATGAQYLTRSCATAVHSRVESEAAKSVQLVLMAHKDRMAALVQRGAKIDAVRAISNTTKKWIAREFNIDIIALNAYYRLHPAQGGCNEEAEVGTMRIDAIHVPIDSDKELNAAKAMLPGVTDYINALARNYSVPKYKIPKNLGLDLNLKLLASVKSTYKLVPETNLHIKMDAALHKAHTSKKVIANLAKARLLKNSGLSFYDVPTIGVAAYLARIENPFRFLQLAF